MPPTPRPLPERFWPKVQKGRGCWLWRGATKRNGYGVISTGGRPAKIEYAHRVSWELANGRPVPEGADVCHSCDVPACVKPAHLFTGSRADNMADMARKGRHRDGETHKVARITAADVRDIIVRLVRGEAHADIADLYGVSPKHVENIRYGYRWKHIERPEQWRRAS
jgi:hypothetical protein